MNNLITDVPGLAVGHAQDLDSLTGTTVITLGAQNRASVTVRGGAPGSRSLSILAPERTGDGADAIVLSGGSAFGLDAAGGVMAALAERGIGFPVGSVRVPIVAQAITFDLLNGGQRPADPTIYWKLGKRAVEAADENRFELGSVGGGFGTTTATAKGGVGSASAKTASGYTVGAIAVVNAVGAATIGDGPHFWAAPYEHGNEFGGLGWPAAISADDLQLRTKGSTPPSTTIALVATDATLTKAETKRLALMGDDGLARAIRPAHAPMDGDTVFAAATCARPGGGSPSTLMEIGAVAADCLARAIARGVFEARIPAEHYIGPPAWNDRFARQLPTTSDQRD